jgi:hypothetical protein
MRRVLVLLGGLFLVLGGCREQETATTFTQDKILFRPIVACVPIIDRSHHDLGWNLSDELSKNLYHRLTQDNQLYVVREESFLNAQKYLSLSDPFEPDMNWMKKAFPDQEFVVFTEVVKHREIPLLDTQESPAELLIILRIHVVDLREKTPKLVLSELIEQSHHIPTPFTKSKAGQVAQVAWGEETFDLSPLGIAHDTLSQQAANHIKEYILSCNP